MRTLSALIPIIAAVAALAATPRPPSSTQPAAVTAALNEGKALALIEVTAIRERDDRPSDGNLVDIVTFRTVKSSGTVPPEIHIVKGFGGRRIGSPPVPGGPLYPNPLAAGERYWIVFNDTDFEKYQQGVVAWWPEKTAPRELLEAAITQRNLAPAAASALKAGTSVALIDVTAVKEEDQRPADGPLLEVVAYRIVKSSGRVPPEIRAMKAPPYPQMPGVQPAPVPAGPLNPNPLKSGQKYWVVFNRAESNPYQNGVVAVFPEKDAPAELEAAVTARQFDR